MTRNRNTAKNISVSTECCRPITKKNAYHLEGWVKPQYHTLRMKFPKYSVRKLKYIVFNLENIFSVRHLFNIELNRFNIEQNCFSRTSLFKYAVAV